LNKIADLLKLEDGTHHDEASKLAERKLGTVRAKLAILLRMETVLAQLVDACHTQK